MRSQTGTLVPWHLQARRTSLHTQPKGSGTHWGQLCTTEPMASHGASLSQPGLISQMRVKMSSLQAYKASGAFHSSTDVHHHNPSHFCRDTVHTRDAHNPCLQSTSSLCALTTNLNLAEDLKAPQGGCAQKGGEQTPLGLSSHEATIPNPWNSSSLATACSREQQGQEMTPRCHNFSHSMIPDLSRTADPCKGSAAAQGSCGTVLSPPGLCFSTPSKARHGM